MVGKECKGIVYLHLHTINGHRSSRAFQADVCVEPCLSASAEVRCVDQFTQREVPSHAAGDLVEQLREHAQSRFRNWDKPQVRRLFTLL